jgi:hypothetical protein
VPIIRRKLWTGIQQPEKYKENSTFGAKALLRKLVADNFPMKGLRAKPPSSSCIFQVVVSIHSFL